MSETEYFSVEVSERRAGEHRVALTGKLDHFSCPSLRDHLSVVSHSTIVLDLSELTFIDGAGADEIATASESIEAGGHHMQIVNAQAPVHRVFDILGLDDLLE